MAIAPGVLLQPARPFEIRFHGRGGMGAVVASQLLANAAFLEGRWAQSFPFFGVERRGAPVAAFARLADGPVETRNNVYEPDVVVVLDPSLLKGDGQEQCRKHVLLSVESKKV